jgi:multicomponent Na+:H+ antiporter subunit E
MRGSPFVIPFITLAMVLLAIWATLSGLFKPIIIMFAFISVFVVLMLTLRLRLMDTVAVPYLRIVSYLRYWVWLFIEILKANGPVIRACLRTEMDINPALVRVRTRCRSDVARTVFANSITLTPGTVTVDIDGDRLLVHALYEESAPQESFAEMDRRSSEAAETSSAPVGDAQP